MELLHHYKIPIAGSRAVIINRSTLVGKPLLHLLLAEDATVTVCHSKSRDLLAITRQADILISAVGRRPQFSLTREMVKDGAVVVDVAMNRVGGKAHRGRGLRERLPEGLVHHAGAGRGRPDDRRDAHGEHPGSRREAAQPEGSLGAPVMGKEELRKSALQARRSLKPEEIARLSAAAEAESLSLPRLPAGRDHRALRRQGGRGPDGGDNRVARSPQASGSCAPRPRAPAAT